MESNLKELREQKGLTQQELADLFGVTQGAIGHYELGRRKPNWKLAKRLADFFEVSFDELFEVESA